MAKLVLRLTPKPARAGKAAITHHDVAAAIKIRGLVMDWQKSRMEDAVIAEVMKNITVADVKSGIDKKDLAGLPSKDYDGKHELYVFVGADKATKIELTIEPEPVFDIAKECPLFAKPGSAKANGEYLGGAENEPHVHVYGRGFHLKLGRDRYNIVQNGTLYESATKDAHEALKHHALKNTLAPFVAASLKKFGFL